MLKKQSSGSNGVLRCRLDLLGSAKYRFDTNYANSIDLVVTALANN